MPSSFQDLIEGARTGDIPRMQTALAEGAPINGAEPGVYNKEISCDTGHTTALMYAAACGYVAAVEFLLDHGANIEAQDGEGQTPLHDAIANNRPDVVRTLVASGANLKAISMDGTVLAGAIRFMTVDDVAWLIDQGAKVNRTIWDGTTALMAAAEQGRPEMVRMLLERGAKANAITKSGSTAQTIATRRHDAATLLALQVGPPPDDPTEALWRAAIEGDLPGLRTALARGAAIDRLTKADKSGGDASALMYAAMCGHRDAVELLLGAGAQIDLPNHTTMTALHFAIANGHLEIVRLLVERGASLRHLAYHNGPPLYHAARAGQLAIAEYLIARGAEVNDMSYYGYTPLYGALPYGHMNIVKLLLNHGAQASLKAHDGTSALSTAERMGDRELLRLLKAK